MYNKAAHRITWADHAKGIAIMLVVYRHVAVGMRRSAMNVSDWLYNIQEVFYNFRMPVFFVLSGVFAAMSLNKKSRKYLMKEKVQTLLYPYLLWGISITLLQIFFSGFTNAKRQWIDLLNVFVQPRDVDHLWYLFALFNTCLLYVLLSQVQFLRNKWIHLVLALVMYAVSYVPALVDYSILTDSFHFYIYFLIGTIISPTLFDKEKSDALLNLNRLWVIVPLFIAGQYLWFVIRNEEAGYMFPMLIVNLIACYFIYIISKRLSETKSGDWLGYLGKYSLYIYILHVPIAAIIRNVFKRMDAYVPSELVLFICWAGGLLTPILLFKIFNRYGFQKLFSLKTKAA